MKKIDRLRERLGELKTKRSQFIRRGYVASVYKIDEEIAELEDLIKDAEEFESRPIREFMSREEIKEARVVPLLLECYLAADYLADCTFLLKQTFSKLGFKPVTVVPEIEEILKLSEKFAGKPCLVNESLGSLIADNETLLSALHKKSRSYLEQRLRDDS